MKYLLIIVFTLMTCACASGPATYGQEEYDDNSDADGAAYITDAIQTRKPMPNRPEWKPMEFYFKHCADSGEGTYYSKTSYECSGPF